MVMARSRVLSVLICLTLVVSLQQTTVAQSWTYQGSSICYNGGQGPVQCYASGTLQQAVSNRDVFNAQFQAGWAAGEGIGNLVTSLLGTWAQHRAKVQAERNDLRGQLASYQNANMDLWSELIRQQRVLIAIWPKWAKFTNQEQNAQSQIAQFETWATQFESAKASSTKNTAIIAGAKDLKFLSNNVEVMRQLNKTLYENASMSYVFTELVSAVVGYHESGAGGEPRERASLAVGVSGPLENLLKQAEAGDEMAQGELGSRYIVGEGIPRNYQEGVRWLRAAADQGSPEAQLHLGELYVDGRGVTQDYVAAHVLFNLAASAGLEKARELRESVAAKLTAEQVGEAQKLAREWKPKKRNVVVEQ